ncbi:MAG: hypothetical protein RLZZ342_180 [Candidatus Parcubacteria bacterium]|jgi:hypothetical protein
MKRFVLTIALLLLPLAALAEDANCNAACQALRDHTGSKPGAPTDDLVCLAYPEIPAKATVWLVFRKIDGQGNKAPLPQWVVPRKKEAGKENARTKFCFGRHWLQKADEVYICSEFPDKSQWHSGRRRESFGGSGAYERAMSGKSNTLNVCLGSDCPARLPD